MKMNIILTKKYLLAEQMLIGEKNVILKISKLPVFT
jgi:hypothetical protein